MYENEQTISFDNIEEVQAFVNAASKCDFEIDLKYNRNFIDAKSLLGVMAIGLKNKLTVCYGGNNENFQMLVDKFAIA